MKQEPQSTGSLVGLRRGGTSPSYMAKACKDHASPSDYDLPLAASAHYRLIPGKDCRIVRAL